MRLEVRWLDSQYIAREFSGADALSPLQSQPQTKNFSGVVERWLLFQSLLDIVNRVRHAIEFVGDEFLQRLLSLGCVLFGFLNVPDRSTVSEQILS
jgi:hypothetical protein